MVASLGYTRMLWNVDSLDWSESSGMGSWVNGTVKRIALRRRRGFRNTVCLLHDNSRDTAAYLGHLIERMRETPEIGIARYDPGHPDALRFPEEPAFPKPHSICPEDSFSVPLEGSTVRGRTGLNALYVLNHSASVLWDIFATGATEAAAAQALAQSYGIPGDLARRDVQTAQSAWRTRAHRPEAS